MLKRLVPIVVVLLLAGTRAARADSITFTGNFGYAGYAIIGFSLSSTAAVDLQWTAGGSFVDAEMALFDGSGQHLITNDDDLSAGSTDPHITQILSAGSYNVFVASCCEVWSYAHAHGGTTSTTDGFNSGTYQIGGFGDIFGLAVAVAGYTYNFPTAPYAVTISTQDINVLDPLPGGSTEVPEPASLTLLGTGLAAVARRWRLSVPGRPARSE